MIFAVSSDLVSSLFRQPSMHLFMLKDRVRLDAYREAIEKAVHPGDVVVDVGSGTGILAFLAARRGARKVYAIERTEIVTLAKKLAVQNHLEKIVEFVHGESLEIQIPEKADVVVSETIGIFGLQENILQTLVDARRRFLKPGGLILPGSINLYVTAVENALLFEQCRITPEDVFGFEFTDLDTVVTGNLLAGNFDNFTQALSPMTPFCSMNTLTNNDITVRRRVPININKFGMLHGVIGWWEAVLVPSVVLSTSPTANPRATSWLDAFFPIDKPFSVCPGDVVVFECRTELRNNNIWWSYNIKLGSQ